jgi:DNA repair protein RecO (recombination protein O)
MNGSVSRTGADGVSPITAKTYITEVICLRAIDFGEADRILHLYSPDVGRISAIAKGAKRAKSKLTGACELLNLSEVQLAKGRNLDVLCQYQPRETFIGVRSDILKLAYGLLFAELVYATEAANADSHHIFEILKHGLHVLDAVEPDEAVAVGIEFQLALLQAAGFHPVLDTCIFTGLPLDPDAVYYCFSPNLGGLTVPDRRKAYQMETGSDAAEWVNLSASTLAVLVQPHQPEWNAGQLAKAQKFLRYYFVRVFEKELHAYHLIFNILEAFPAVSAGEKSISEKFA